MSRVFCKRFRRTSAHLSDVGLSNNIVQFSFTGFQPCFKWWKHSDKDSMNAIKYGFVRQGYKIFSIPFSLLTNHNKKEKAIILQTYILKSQTEINLHEKISENFKKIPVGALKNLTTYRELQCMFCFYASEECLLFKFLSRD